MPLDRVAIASRRRRRLRQAVIPEVEPSGLNPLDLIEDEHYNHIRPVGKPQKNTSTTKDKE